MSRFSKDIDALEADVGMQRYRRLAKTQGAFDAAEWIEALHREHWETLEELRQARAETEGERLARAMADMRPVLARAKMLQTVLGVQRTCLGSVLGDTPTLGALKDVSIELRGTIASLEGIVSQAAS